MGNIFAVTVLASNALYSPQTAVFCSQVSGLSRQSAVSRQEQGKCGGQRRAGDGVRRGCVV